MEHLTKKDKDTLKRAFGAKEPSDTRIKEFTIFLDEDGYVCDCEDFSFREGSYEITYKDEKGRKQAQQGCKHIARHLRKQGLEVTLKKGGFNVEV